MTQTAGLRVGEETAFTEPLLCVWVPGPLTYIISVPTPAISDVHDSPHFTGQETEAQERRCVTQGCPSGKRWDWGLSLARPGVRVHSLPTTRCFAGQKQPLGQVSRTSVPLSLTDAIYILPVTNTHPTEAHPEGREVADTTALGNWRRGQEPRHGQDGGPDLPGQYTLPQTLAHPDNGIQAQPLCQPPPPGLFPFA